MSAPKVGDRVQAVLTDEFGTELPDMVGTVIPIAEWPATMPSEWTEENTLVVRWDRATPSYSVYRPNVAARMLRVLETAAPCGHTDAHHAVAGSPELQACDECGAEWIEDDGTEAEALAEVSVPAFPDVMVHGRLPEPRWSRAGVMPARGAA
jgi:hypothetical protein